jgi:polysaccharide pyruvyl transferase WcaK-like protein
MHFLIESGTYAIDNVGDIAMLQRTVWRLREAYPDATLSVVTEQPERLTRVLPGVCPVAASPWFRMPVFPVPRRWEYTALTGRIRWREKLLAGWLPRVARAGKRYNPWARESERDAADRFYQAVNAADAVVAAGGGYINDHFYEHAWKVFATLSLAQGLGKPTAMFSIGLGPVSRPELVYHGGAVLRRVCVLALRESQRGPDEARKLGVPAAKVMVTGDDAVAVAAAQPVPPAQERDAIGVNLRMSVEAAVPDAAAPCMRDAVCDVAERVGARLVPLVVRTAQSPENDVDAVQRLFGPEIVNQHQPGSIYSPQQALARMAACRVVVTGAYHNAVFALAMGIPVVGLYRSAYYQSKLEGVAAAFGIGMQALALEDPELRENLIKALTRLWDDAPALSGPLKQAAAEQIAMSDDAYARFFDEVRRGAVGKSA